MFCDLSTPKGKTAQSGRIAAKSTDNPELHALEAAIDAEAGPEKPPFTIYDDIREKLVARGIPDAEENLVRLIGVEVVALQHLDQQDMVGHSVPVHAGEPFRFHPHGGLAEVKRRTKQLVDMLRMAVDAGDRTVILYADSDYAAVRVGKCDQMNRQRFASMRALFRSKSGDSTAPQICAIVIL